MEETLFEAKKKTSQKEHDSPHGAKKSTPTEHPKDREAEILRELQREGSGDKIQDTRVKGKEVQDSRFKNHEEKTVKTKEIASLTNELKDVTTETGKENSESSNENENPPLLIDVSSFKSEKKHLTDEKVEPSNVSDMPLPFEKSLIVMKEKNLAKTKPKERTVTLSDRIILEVRTSRTGEETPEAMVQFLASLSNLRKRYMLLWKKGIPITLEIAVLEQTIHFYLTIPPQYQAFIESQLTSQYPKSMLQRTRDFMPDIIADANVQMAQIRCDQNYLYPLRTFKEFKDVDPLSSLLGALAKTKPGDKVAIQFLLVPISQSWQSAAQKHATTKQTDSTGATLANPHAAVITEKASAAGFSTSIRIAVAGEDTERSKHLMYEIGNSFSSFNHPTGNTIRLRKAFPWDSTRLKNEMIHRKKNPVLTPMHIFNVLELATLFHFPTLKLANIPNISWYKVILSQAPENLPIAENLTEEEKKDINFFARTEYKNKQTVFGIKRVDRRRHVYVIGKSGTGKSTFIANMAINDLRNREGFCVIDPHGDLCEHILQYIPSYRVNDIIYLDPSDPDRSFAINPLEVTEENQKELVASGIVAIFKKLYGTSWGPRLEYILRNTIVSVMEMPNPTLLMVPELLANPSFRAKVVERLSDPVLKSFWTNEFEMMTDKLRVEAISPIQNKVGQFTSSQRIRNIIGHPKSSIDIEKAMNEGKVLILNLSQGYLGEDNAALLGAMIITKIQLAAMNRVSIPEEERRDFYLYVDEFQNFATTSFIKILSEARKFRLSLILANQYIAQVPEDVRAAIFGNAGTLMSFLVGATDASYMAKEFSERFKEEDLLALGNYQAILKLYIDGITQSPFHCYTLPLPHSKTQNMEKVKRLSRERYTKPVIAGKLPAGDEKA